MKSKAAWVVVALFIALCGSACGSLLFNGIPRGPGGPGGVSTIFTTINDTLGPQGPRGRIVTTRSGSGNATLGGPFAVHGTLLVRGSCSGSGMLVVEATSRSMGEGTGTMCPNPTLHMILDDRRGSARIDVHAPARIHWSIRILERP